MANIKFSQFTQKTTLGTVDFLVGYTGAQNIQIDPVDLLSSYPTGSGGTGRVAFWEPSNNLSSDYLFKWDNSSNRLGLGVETPTATLHAVTADDTIARFESSDNKAAISISDDDTTGYFSAENGRIGFGTGLGASSSNISILTSNSNVGIGTVSPVAKLHVYGTLIATGISQLGSGGSNVYLTSASAGNVGVGTSSPGEKFEVHGNIKARFAANGAIGQIKLGNLSNIYADNGDLQIRNNVTGLVKVTSGGNVGIGTMTPQTKFHVNGGQALFASDTAVNPLLPFGIEVYRNEAGNSNVLIHQDDGNHESVLHMRCGGNDTKIRTGPNTYALRIDTESVTDAVVLTNGASPKVGIATDNPTTTLELGKSGVVDTDFQMQSDQAGKYFKIASAGNFTELKSVGDQNLFLNSSGTGGYISFLAGNSERMRINYNGKIGIGTTTPSRLLQVKDTSGIASIAITSANTGTAQLELGGTSDNDIAGISYNSSTQKLFLKTNNTGQLYVNNSGNVGIGTDSPNAKLNVISADETVARFERNSGSGFAAIDIKDSVGTTGNSAIRFSDTTATSGEINYEHADDSLRISTSSSEKMRITSSGNVGIGTTSPNQKLEVNGGVNADSYKISNVTVLSGSADVYVGSGGGTGRVFLNNTSGAGLVLNGANVGIGVTSPASKLEVDGGDIEVDDSASGLILRSPDGTRYRVTVANGGTLSISAV